MFSLRSAFRMSFVFVLGIALVGCAAPRGATVAEKRTDAQQMRTEALVTFYSKLPNMKETIETSPGYGVFSAVSTHTIIVATGNGFGIIHDNTTGKDTYMRALKLGGGLGAGIQGLRAIVVFHDAETMKNVLEHGWGVTGRVEAAAKVGDVGDSGAMVFTLPGMSIYRFTENGVMLGGAIEGAKVWQDSELN